MTILFQTPVPWWAFAIFLGLAVLTGIWTYCRSLSRQARAGLLCAFPGAETFLKSGTGDTVSSFSGTAQAAGMSAQANMSAQAKPGPQMIRSNSGQVIDQVIEQNFKINGSGPSCRTRARQQMTGRICLENVDIQALRSMPLVREARGTVMAKAMIDIAASALLILFMLPLMAITAILIKLESRGPVFYRQIRAGKNGRTFNILKFRSMHIDAEKSGPCWARENDCRVTRIGAFLRRSRIDEIPQAFNVLAGQMSFVGPRPERPEFFADLQEKVPHFEERLCVKPGITGWAQINYPYGASVEDAAKKLGYDLFYIQNYSFLLDILIIIKTIKVAFTGTGSR